MTTLPYAAPSTANPPQYLPFALASGLLTLSTAIFTVTTVAVFLRSTFDPWSIAYRLTILIAFTIASALILAAIPAFARVRSPNHRPFLLTCYILASLHLLLTAGCYSASVIYGLRSGPFSLTFNQIMSAVFFVDRIIFAALLLAALIFLFKLQSTAIKVLAIIFLAPGIILLPSRALLVLLLNIFTGLRSPALATAFDILMYLYNAFFILLCIFWLILMILALVYAAKTRPASNST